MKPKAAEPFRLHPVIRRRLLFRNFCIACGLLLLLASLLDHLGVFGYRGNDRTLFASQPCAVTRAAGVDDITIRSPGGVEAPVHLLGLKSNDHPMPALRQAIEMLLAEQNVRVKFDPVVSRDDRGRLPVYLYLPDGQMLQTRLIEDGLALADEDSDCELLPHLTRAQADAARHKRGLWADPLRLK